METNSALTGQQSHQAKTSDDDSADNSSTTPLFDDIINSPAKFISDTSFHLLRATSFAAFKHGCQTRKNARRSAYIEHPLGVAHLLRTIGNVSDVDTLCAAVLHDTLEDTNTTYDELKDMFGHNIAELVQRVTDNKSLSRKAQKLEQIKRAKVLPRPAKLIKLADKLYNLKELFYDPPSTWDAQRRKDYIVFAACVVDNMRGTNSALEKELDKVLALHGFPFEPASDS